MSTGGADSVTIDFDSDQGELLEVSGNAELSAFGFVMAYGEFYLFKGEIDQVDDGSIEAFDAQVRSIDLKLASVFAGVGGTFIRKAAGEPTGFDHTKGAVGFYVDNANLSLSILQNAGTPTQKYLGLEFTLDGLGLEGIQGLTFEVNDAYLRVNWASEGDRLDWVEAYENDTSDPKKIAQFTELTRDVALQIHGQMELSAFGFVMAW